ncbi:hypothetical protein PBAL39_06521 [Pedobacter sp. BAL39]|nr:hypothetical protein PBAL39_06521 [Pedobacter sp. BAL39]
MNPLNGIFNTVSLQISARFPHVYTKIKKAGRIKSRRLISY